MLGLKTAVDIVAVEQTGPGKGFPFAETDQNGISPIAQVLCPQAHRS